MASGILSVAIESPSTTKDYSPGQIEPVIVIISDSENVPMANASVLLTSSYDMQFVHVPYQKPTEVNNTTAWLFGPTSTVPANETNVGQGGLVVLNDAGFVQLPYSAGDWTLELQIEPLTGAYPPFQESFTIHVTTPPPLTLYLVLAAGWIITLGLVGLIIRRRIIRRKPKTAPASA